MDKLEILQILREMNIVDEYISLSKKHQIQIKELFKKYEVKRFLK